MTSWLTGLRHLVRPKSGIYAFVYIMVENPPLQAHLGCRVCMCTWREKEGHDCSVGKKARISYLQIVGSSQTASGVVFVVWAFSKPFTLNRWLGFG